MILAVLAHSLWLPLPGPFHTRRVHLTFRDAFRGTGITVAVRPVEDPG